MKIFLIFFTGLLFSSRFKIFLLRLLGLSIGKNCNIGCIVLLCRNVKFGDDVRVGNFNLIHRLRFFELDSGSRINEFNWITGAGSGEFSLGRNSAITRFHFFEASGNIYIGHDSIIAGRGSHFFTHGISSKKLDDVRAIVISPWSYIGSSSRFVPGSGVGLGTFVGMGSVVTKSFSEQYVLLAGNPAIVKKTLHHNDAYFSREFLPHDHHPADYRG